ncbi:MAG: 6-bladed beta-propeller, partial [Candidatus Latescibacterota bacterium]
MLRPLLVWSRSACLTAACACLLVSSAAAEWRGREVVENGELHVKNPSTPAGPELTLELEEMWTIGGDSDADGEFFGLITDIAIHPSGEIYLVDTQLSEVKVFTRDGEYLRTIGREGEGPGEFRRPRALLFDPDGNVGVVQSRPSRVVMLTADGVPAEPLALPNPDDGGFRALQDGAFRGGSMVLLGRNFRRLDNALERTSALVRVDQNGNEIARYHHDSSVINMANPIVEEEGFDFPWTVAPNGNVYASLDRTYRVHVWGPDGGVERVIHVDYEPLLRTDSQIEERKEELASRIRFRGRRGGMGLKFDISDRERDIEWLEVAEDGHLWVLSSRGVHDLPTGVIGHFDIFDSDGHLLQRVTLKGDADFKEDRLVMAGNRLFVIKQFEAAARAMAGAEVEMEEEFEEEPEPMSVVCYRLDWSPARAVAAP